MKKNTYLPSKNVLKKYADVLVNFALNSGKGIKEGEVVQCIVPDVAKDLALELRNAILKSGGFPMLRLLPTGFDRDFYNIANEDQLKFFPKKYLRERVRLIDHSIGIIADPDPLELSEVDPKKIILARDSNKDYRDWLNEKEHREEYTWTLAMWGVEAKAEEVGLSLKDYWQQIITACFLDEADPVAKWRETTEMKKDIKRKLNSLKTDYLIVKGPDIDMKVKLGDKRIWKGGSGRNIPSFELFTSPDWRGVEGWVKFNQPLYRYGQIIRNISLEIKKGLVVKAHAETGDRFLQEMFKSKNADKIGEYSLTDKRMSRITHVMAETLFDENIGGPFGNTHMAIGMAYKDCYDGDPSKVSKKEWKKLGYNDSAEHTDMISTTDRVVTAVLPDGTEKIIYKDGMFVL